MEWCRQQKLDRCMYGQHQVDMLRASNTRRKKDVASSPRSFPLTAESTDNENDSDVLFRAAVTEKTGLQGLHHRSQPDQSSTADLCILAAAAVTSSSSRSRGGSSTFPCSLADSRRRCLEQRFAVYLSAPDLDACGHNHGSFILSGRGRVTSWFL